MARDYDPLAENAIPTGRDPSVDKLRLMREQDQIRHTMETPLGRGLVWEILASSGVFRSTFTGESTHTSAYNEGRRAVGLELFAKVMKHAPRLYDTMTQENADG